MKKNPYTEGHQMRGTLALSVTIKEDESLYGDGQYHLCATISVCDYENEKARGLDNYGPLNGLQISAQALSSEPDWGWYGRKLAYAEVFRVDLEVAESMFKTLKKITLALSKIEEQFGPPATLHQYVLRFARAIGAMYFVVIDDEASSRNNIVWKPLPLSASHLFDDRLKEFYEKRSTDKAEVAIASLAPRAEEVIHG